MFANVTQTQFNFFRTNFLPVSLLRIGTSFEDFAFVSKKQRGPVGYPWQHGKQFLFRGGIGLNLGKHFRARANQAHLMSKDVKKLWKFIQLVFSKIFSDSRNSGVADRS